MKKTLKVTAAILVLLFVSFWGYIAYQRAASYRSPIHQQATALFRVDVYGIYKSLLGDYFKTKKGKNAALIRGLDIPANIFVYPVKGKSAATLFCSLEISSYDRFIRSLPKDWNIPEVKDGNCQTAISADKNWTICFNRKRVAIAYSPKREEVLDILKDLVLQQHIQSVAASPFRSTEQQEGHLTWCDGQREATLDFLRGKIKIKATGKASGLNIPETVQHYAALPGDALHFWLYMDTKPFLAGKKFNADSLSLSGDSILAALPHGLELNITDPVIQRDSVVTYEYNDDFEKVATATVKETMVPGIFIHLPLNTASLIPYLQRQHLLSDSGKINTAFFPLYQLYAKVAERELVLSTVKSSAPARQQVNANDFFHLDIDFDLLKKQKELAPLLKYSQVFKKAEARAYKGKDDLITLEATLFLKDDRQQALLQLSALF